MRAPLLSYPPPIGTGCRLAAHIWHNDEILIDTRSNTPYLVDLSGGASHIEWVPNQQLTSWRGIPCLEYGGFDTYSLRVWKRRHGWLDISGDASRYEEAPFSDAWADWLDQHLDLRYLIGDVEFAIQSVSNGDNGVHYWLTGRRTVE